MSTLKVDKLTDVAGQELIVKDKGNVIQTVINKVDTVASLNATSFTEVDSDYRIQITPVNSANRIVLSITTAGTMNGSNNTIFMARIQNFTSGSAAHITSTAASGNRHRVDYVARPNNGSDGNDVYVMHLFGFDDPGTTSTQTYGFDYRREVNGSGSIFIGQSEDGDVTYSSRTPTILIAQEIVL
tara:strand:- start:919 stop:1473 length:555 start_codon:yes stop_codon:yes gene_type:complete